MEVRFHFDLPRVFGFGTGWGGFCEPFVESAIITDSESNGLVTETPGEYITTGALTRDAPWMCEIDVKPYDC